METGHKQKANLASGRSSVENTISDAAQGYCVVPLSCQQSQKHVDQETRISGSDHCMSDFVELIWTE